MHSHMLRATPASDSDIGPIGQGGTITLQSISKQSQNAIIDSMKAKKSNAEVDLLLPLYWLRYAQTRQLRRKLVAHLNYLASVRRRLTMDAEPTRNHEDSGHDIVSIDDDGITRVVDCNGVRIMYDCVFDDLKDTEHFLINVGTMYLRKFRDRFVPDRAVMCQQLLENEVAYVDAKHQLISALMLAYDHCLDPRHQACIRQHVSDIISRRPLLDTTAHTFIASYASNVELMRLESAFVSDVVSALMVNEFHMTPLRSPDSQPLGGQKYRGSVVSVQCSVSDLNHSVFDLFSSVSSIADVLECVHAVCLGAYVVHCSVNPGSVCDRMLIYRAFFQKALLDWRLLLEEQLLSHQLIHRRNMQAADAVAHALVGAAPSGISSLSSGSSQSAFSAAIDSGSVMAEVFFDFMQAVRAARNSGYHPVIYCSALQNSLAHPLPSLASRHRR